MLNMKRYIRRRKSDILIYHTHIVDYDNDKTYFTVSLDGVEYKIQTSIETFITEEERGDLDRFLLSVISNIKKGTFET